ncbi:MAG: 5,10-methylenetetrahydrofolate reductase, partial [Actinobacteria bacterium]|nr:5,10-methylenetetrahydrofolate reductase [Actinomycetota bacterium]
MARISDLIARGRTFSFEFFPPKTDSAQLSLGRAIGELESLAPSFVSVTYGAGGSTRQRTHAVVSWMRKETSLTPMAHLTCQGHVRSEIRDILNAYADDGVQNILALGGDVPVDGDPAPSDYTYASELLDDVLADGRFSVGVAAHPEVHPRSTDRVSDRRHLAAKLARADFAITQFFFDNDDYLRFRDRCAAAGIKASIVPGILPITRFPQVTRFAERCGAKIPRWLAE